jgi:hypothetical protein
MVRWHGTTFKAVATVAAFASLLVASGAGLRWGELSTLLSPIFNLL